MKHNPYLKNLKTTVFDIETTGLYSYKDRVISASFCDPSDGSLVQFFLNDPADEKHIIEQTLDELAKYDAVITYNGDRFDLPFILARAKKHGIADALPFFWAIDLYKWVKKYWPPAPMMESLSQKSVEDALGLTARRTDEIGGGECIDLYARWTQIGDESAKDKILLHNGDDVRQLGRIGHSLSSLPYHKIAFENGFMLKGDAPSLITKTVISGSSLRLEGLTSPGKMPADIYDDLFRYVYEFDTGRFSLDLRLTDGPGIKFIDLAALPLDSADFEPLAGYHSGFLILSKDGVPQYKEANRLTEAMLLKLI